MRLPSLHHHLIFISPFRLFWTLYIPPITKFIRRVVHKMKHKIKNRKSKMQIEMDKLAEQYGVSQSELRLQVQGV